MTPREIILQNLQGAGSVRIGMNFHNGRMQDHCDGFLDPSPTWSRRTWQEGNMEYYNDEWGNVWHRIAGMSRGGEIHQPGIADWSDLEGFRLPDLANPARFETARDLFSHDADHFRIGWLPGFPFSICRYLRKMDVYFQDLVLEREKIDDLHGRVTDLLEQVIIRFAQVGADGIGFAEDWGIQDRLLISPTMWREIYKPLYQRLCGTAHRHHLSVLMHSCGYNWEILDDLAEVGVNAFQFDQPGIYGLERLAQKLKTLKVCLFSPVDIQKVLPTGNRELIEAEAKKMVELFEGGFIAKDYTDLKGIGVEPEWDQWAYEAFVRTFTEESDT